ncbi:MAG: hypothetical protein IT359_17160 [Gemmatimonadaceae bacterium]|nr:hypothetical protein [Gemmatimonadaceae bacterium]
MTDIEGTVWLDRLTAEPREVEARYVRTPRPEYESRSTATVRFARLADGRWIVASWAIRTPVLTIARRPGGRVDAIRAPAEERVDVVAIQEEGGFVEFGDGRFSPLGAISVDTRTEGAPSGELQLLLSGTGRRVSVVDDEPVTLVDVSPGRYMVLAYSPAEPPGETRASRAELDVVAGRTTTVRLDWSRDTSSTAPMCPAPKGGASSIALLVVFLDSASGQLVRTASARLRATHDQLVDPSRIRSTVTNRPISSAPDGWFIDCERRAGERVELQFSVDKRRIDIPLGLLGDRPLEVREVMVPMLAQRSR